MNRTINGTTTCLAAVLVVGSIAAAGVPAVATDSNGSDAPPPRRDAGPETSLAALEHELDDLRSTIDVARAEEVRALVQDVLADGETSLLLGGALNYQRSEYGTLEDEMDVYQWTADASLQLPGASLAAAVVGTGLDNGADRDEIGFLVQAGYFLTEKWELYARYEWGDLDGAGTVNDNLSIVTVGANLFLRRHALKWSTDVGYAFEPVDPAWGTRRAGWRPDSPGGDGQVVVRSQLQLLF